MKINSTYIATNMASIYADAKKRRLTKDEIDENVKQFRQRLESQRLTDKGYARFPKSIIDYVWVVDYSLHQLMHQTEVEFCYVYEGERYSTHREGTTTRSTDELIGELPMQTWDQLPRHFYWKNSDSIYY